MKPAPFDLFTPATLEEAVRLLGEHGGRARPLAGGQSLVAAMNFRALEPAVIVDLNGIAELAYVRPTPGGGVAIGAMTRNATLERDPVVAARVPLLHAALPHLAHPAIRSRGTIGGSLAYADPAAELPAVTLACGARYRAVSVRGARWIEASDFFRDTFATVLAPDELLSEVEIPPLPGRVRWGFVEFARRHGDRVLMGISALLPMDPGGRVTGARIACQNAAPVPFLARRAAAALEGRALDRAAIDAAAGVLHDEVAPPDEAQADPGYQRHLARVLLGRALAQAMERAA